MSNPFTEFVEELTPFERVVSDVSDERARQDEKWGEQNHPDKTGPRYAEPEDSDRDRWSWFADEQRALTELRFGELADGGWSDILAEEVAEAFAEADPDKLRAELVQVAAVAVAWVEAIDRRAS